MLNPQPKPVRAQKARKPLRRKRWGVSHGPSKTKHGRRERNFDRMWKLSELGKCAVMEWAMAHRLARWMDLVLNLNFGECRGRLEVAHLSLGKTAGRRRAPDSQTAPVCHLHHTDIDGKIGGKAPWYVALGYDGQQELRRWLIDWADAQLAGTPSGEGVRGERS